jgi:hypothetical protein
MEIYRHFINEHGKMVTGQYCIFGSENSISLAKPSLPLSPQSLVHMIHHLSVHNQTFSVSTCFNHAVHIHYTVQAKCSIVQLLRKK